jgi:hypothetical protein
MQELTPNQLQDGNFFPLINSDEFC